MRTIPFSPPDIGEAECNEVAEALRSGWITTGKRTKLFEQRLAEWIGAPKVVCLNSATAAMELCLRILGIKEGDEVIVPAYTYTATASVVCHVGATPIMIDVLKDSFELDYDSIACKITKNTKAIMPVDIGGRMCDYKRILAAIESKKELYSPSTELQRLFDRVIVIADSAHGFGAKRDGKNSGEAADFTCFSFHAVKNLTTGEGGAATWLPREGLDNEWLYNQFMLFSLHGQNKDAFKKNQIGAWEYDIIYPAYKCNMTDIMAAIGLIQLDRYTDILARRRSIIERYDEAAKSLGLSTLEHFTKDIQSSGHLYLLRIPNATETDRNALITRMAERGVATNVHYKPLPMMTAYKNLGYSMADYPNAFYQYQNEITLPLHTKLSDEDVQYVIDTLKDCL